MRAKIGDTALLLASMSLTWVVWIGQLANFNNELLIGAAY